MHIGDPTSLFLCLALAVFIVGRLAMPLCKRLDERQKAVELAAVKELARLRNRLRPGIYTFRWADGRMLEPTADHSPEATRTREVVVQFLHGNRKSRKITELPYPFQQELLQQMKNALRAQ